MPLMSEMMRDEAPTYESPEEDVMDVFVDDDGNTYGLGDLPY